MWACVYASMSAYVLCAYPHMCMCLSVYLCTCMAVHLYMHGHVCMLACRHMCVLCECTSLCVFLCACVRVWSCMSICASMRACLCICTCDHTCVLCCVCCVLFHVCEHAHMHMCAPATHFTTHSHSTALGSSQRRHGELTRAGPWAGNGARGSSRPAPRTAVARRTRWRSARESDPGVRRGGLGAAGSSAHTSALTEHRPASGEGSFCAVHSCAFPSRWH